VISLSPNAAGVVHTFGFSGHGFQLVPVAGAIVCDLLLHGRTQRQITAFTAERLMARRAAA
jgi:sarcosine oxidase, subunit beta